MNFLDRTGHIFALDSYDEYPIGYEYQETPYIFWFDTEHGYKLSVNNYYFKPIRIVTRLFETIPYNNINIKIENSNKFFLIGSKIIEEKFMGINDINESIFLNESDIKNELNYSITINSLGDNIDFTEDENNDINGCIAVEDNGEYYLITTFYAIVNSDEEGTWTTNIIINANEEYCPITIGAEIVDENEELIINGKNIGVILPKEIINAVYSSNINNSYSDEKFYYLKMKEYLMNFMTLKGQIGNYKSIIDGLKWFEWDAKLSISKLIKNDNRVQNQYVRDFFDILNDNIYSYQLFKETSLLNIELPLTEDGEQELQNMNNYFWGEGKPTVISKISKNKEIYYDEKEYPYIRGYFDYTFSDLGIKLCFLKYYYEKYFLPIHIKLHNISMAQKVYANDIKFIVKTAHGITGTPIYVGNKFIETEESIIDINGDNTDIDNNTGNDVIFNYNGYNIIYFNRYYKKDIEKDYSIENKLYIDTDYNEFSHYTTDFVTEDNKIYYEINDTCLRIPITFRENKYYDVQLIFSRYIDKNNDSLITENNDTISSNMYQLFSTSFKFIQTDDKKYQALILYPKRIHEQYAAEEKFDSLYWLNNIFRIDLIVNGKLYEYIFTAKMPEFNIELGKLKYRYDNNFKQLESIEDGNIKFNTHMYLPNLVNVNNYNFDEEIILLSNNLREYINTYYKESIKFMNKKYLNACHLLKLTDTFGNEIKYEVDNVFNKDTIKWDDLNLFVDKNNESIDLYRNFFNEDGTYNFDTKILTINKHPYDLYLMHDFEYWYVILISKEPIDFITEADKKFKFSNKSNEVKIGNYILKYIKSDKKFLINRYLYIPTDGINHFNTDDIIVTSLKNNDKLMVKLNSGAKWTISPVSLSATNSYTVNSNTELCIISIVKNLITYKPGYYNISVNYSIDDYVQHTYTATAKFRIN